MSVINTNLKSLQAQDSLNINNRKLSTAMQRLSTGTRINSAADDAAGLSISTRMDSQVRGLNMAIKNANDAMSVTQTAEGAIDEVTNILQRMRELSVQSASDTNNAEDRSNMNQEVEQLSAEIDRIAGTTQFNNMNILDGSFGGKIFQIGSNAGQTLQMSIGSMKSNVLGVAAVTTTSMTNTSATSGTAVDGAKAVGVSASPTVVSLEFASSDAYTFTLTDSATGIATTITAATVDLTNSLSKAAFVETINEALKDSQADTTVTGSVAVSAAMTSGTLDITDAANFSKIKFAIKLDGGETYNIDLSQRLSSTSGVTASEVTTTEIAAAMQSELQLIFDDNITATESATTGFLSLSDAQGRRIEISQGGGNGFLFGTDAANGGTLMARETARNPISVEWEGDNLLVTNQAGGKIALSGYAASANSAVIFNTVDDAQVDGVNEPILLATAGTTAPTMDAVTFKGITEPSEISLRFSDLVGNGASADYAFKLTNGSGDTYADFSTTALNVFGDLASRDATIATAIRTALSTGVTALSTAGDTTFEASEFEVTVSGDTISIRNTMGRAMAVENFSSSHGYMVATPLNEPQSSTTLASQNAYISETRIQLNTGAFGQDFSATGTNRFTLSVDGVLNSANVTISVDGSAAGSDLLTGSNFASAVQTALRAADVNILANGTVTGVTQTLSAITVTYDEDTAELVIRDTSGRSIGFGYDSSANGLATTGTILTQDFVTGASNKGLAVNRTSGVAQGDVVESTRVSMTLSEDDTNFTFALNGTYLDSGLATTAATVEWDASDDFATSTMKTKLDAMVQAINADHPEDVVEYAVSGRTLTFWQRNGGPLEISGFKTANTHQSLSASVAPAEGQGEATTLSYRAHTVALAATAIGSLAVASTAVLNVEGDDIYSMKISNGEESFSFSSTVLDISDPESVDTFLIKMENALSGSGISATMDTSGNMYFSRADGGQIVLQEFNSATGRKGTWTPGTGQGDAINLTGGGAVSVTPPALASSGTTTTTRSSGGTSVAQISIASQEGASNALNVIDKAISYVNSQRSMLGAIQNRLTHTVDNLANIVTNTAASRSRIKDTDYATETAELARTQIIQQAATAMLAQANQAPQGVLALLR
jgi:flagellin